MAKPYPGLPTDLQAHWTAYMATAEGPSRVDDRVFPMRWGYVGELRRLGAKLDCVPGGVRIAGRSCYHGTEVVASDLRASAALILAGLSARGTSIIHAAHHLERGYGAWTASLPSFARGSKRGGHAATNTYLAADGAGIKHE